MKESVIILVTLAISAALRKRSAAVRHWVLAVGIVFAGLAPLLGLVLPEWHPALRNRVFATSPARAPGASVTRDVEFSIQPNQDRAKASTAMSLDRVLRMIWMSGTALSLLALFAGLCRLASLAAPSTGSTPSCGSRPDGSGRKASRPATMRCWAAEWTDSRTPLSCLHSRATFAGIANRCFQDSLRQQWRVRPALEGESAPC